MPISVTVPNSVPIGQTVVVMADFRFFKMAAVHHLGFSKFEILPARPILRPNMRHHATLCADRSNRWGDMADF